MWRRFWDSRTGWALIVFAVTNAIYCAVALQFAKRDDYLLRSDGLPASDFAQYCKDNPPSSICTADTAFINQEVLAYMLAAFVVMVIVVCILALAFAARQIGKTRDSKKEFRRFVTIFIVATPVVFALSLACTWFALRA